jgi:hypothetical protein
MYSLGDQGIWQAPREVALGIDDRISRIEAALIAGLPSLPGGWISERKTK